MRKMVTDSLGEVGLVALEEMVLNWEEEIFRLGIRKKFFFFIWGWWNIQEVAQGGGWHPITGNIQDQVGWGSE